MNIAKMQEMGLNLAIHNCYLMGNRTMKIKSVDQTK